MLKIFPLGMLSSIMDQNHPLSGADHESYFNLHCLTPGYQPRGEGDCGYLAQYDQVSGGRMGLVGLGRTPMMRPQAGEAHQPWLATHLGEGNRLQTYSEGTLLAMSQHTRPWQLSLLLFLSMGAQFVFAGCGVPVFPSWFPTTFLTIAV